MVREERRNGVLQTLALQACLGRCQVSVNCLINNSL